MLVSAIMPIMSIYRLPLGQYGYTGHIINLPQDVISFAHSLPRLPSELDVLVVRKEKEQSHHDFRVQRAAIQEALEWLLQNNKYYRANQVHLNQDVLQPLPENGDISELTSLQLDESTTNEHSQPSYMEPTFQAPLCLMLSYIKQSKRQFVSPLRNVRVDQPTPSCGQLLVEHQSMSSPLMVTSAWPSPHCSPPELLTSWDNAATKSPLVTTSSIC